MRIKTLDAYCSKAFSSFFSPFPFTLSEVKFIYINALLFSILPSGFFFIALALLCPEVSKLFIKDTNILLCSFEQMCWCICFPQNISNLIFWANLLFWEKKSAEKVKSHQFNICQDVWHIHAKLLNYTKKLLHLSKYSAHYWDDDAGIEDKVSLGKASWEISRIYIVILMIIRWNPLIWF